MSDQPVVISIDLAGPAQPVVPELREGLALDLPEGAAQNEDGSVTLTFDDPVTITYRPVGGTTAVQETMDHFLLQRIKGRQLFRVMDAAKTRAANLLLSLCSGVSEAKLRVLFGAMAAPDLTAARHVVQQFIGVTDQSGLPEHAVQREDGTILLPLAYPAPDGDGEERGELAFSKLKAEALVAMTDNRSILTIGLQRACGMTPKAATGLLDDMDAADVTAVQRVIGFLSGIGRKTGG